ncbi:MAG: hypothetical protein HYX79_10490 [Chloroflexi bacterium]|nr:hypothetical protein [Chloroflexota bacterium]
MIPRHCREVSLKKVTFSLTKRNIMETALGKLAYINTNYMVLNNGPEWAVVKVRKAGEQGLFQKIKSLEIISMPRDTAYLEKSDVDVQNVGVMVRLAEEAAKDALVVKGKFEHISFVHQERTVPLVVWDVVPPNPPKIVELAEAALATGRIRKPIRIVPKVMDLNELARTRDTKYVMFPCYASALAGLESVDNAFYLDQIPGLKVPVNEITLIGCELSVRIFTFLYGQKPAYMELCPKKMLAGTSGPCLCRCCVVDDGHAIEGNAAYVPWGASVGEVEEAIIDLFGLELDQTLLDNDGLGADEFGVRTGAYSPTK